MPSLDVFMDGSTPHDILLDQHCINSIDDNINLSVPWFLMAAYAYYIEDDPILTDEMYDHLVRKLRKNWDEIEHHHKHLIDEDQLWAGTYMGDYPPIVADAVHQIKKDLM